MVSMFGGLLFIALGAFSSGTFAVPFSKISQWNWESQWLIYSSGAYLIFPLLFCLSFSGNFREIFHSTSSSVLVKVFILGAVYGIGNLSFGLALRYLGLSLGYALSLGLMMAIGTLIPPLIDGKLQLMMQTSGGGVLIAGIILAAIGIGFSARAGILKDREISTEQGRGGVPEYNLTKGFLAAFLVGITGSAMALGIEQGTVISEIARSRGVDPLFSITPVLLLLLSGTFVTTLIWCLFLGFKNRSLKNYIRAVSRKKLAGNYLWALLAGFLWFIQFILFGMGKSKMGSFSFIAWGILMALTIAFATVWGLIRKEWKGASRKVYIFMGISLLVLIISSFIIGVSGSL